MKIYTRTGDKGETGIIGGRVAKDDVRVEAYGTVDELNCFVGQALAMLDAERDQDMLADFTQIQHELFDCGHDLALLEQDPEKYMVHPEMVAQLETWIDKYDAEAPEITRFILPGGSALSALLHVCRTVCRRAERRVVTLMGMQAINPAALTYLNRLSDLFFVVARAANCRAGLPDTEYIRSREVFRRKK